MVKTKINLETDNTMSVREKSLVYALNWCNSDHANKSSYPVSDMLDVANTIYAYLNRD